MHTKRLMFLTVVLAALAFSKAALAQTAPQYQSAFANSHRTGMEGVFLQSAEALAAADSACDIQSCHDLVNDASTTLAEGIAQYRGGNLVSGTKQDWRERFESKLVGLRLELEAVQDRHPQGQGVVYRENLLPRARLMTVAVTCDNVAVIGALLAGAYGLVCLPCGAILGVTVAYGYVKCIFG